MIIALAAYKTHNINEVPEILYLGDNGVKLLEVAAAQGGKGFVRARRFQLDHGIPVSLGVPVAPVVAAKPAVIVDTEREKAAKKAEAKAKKDAEKAAKKAVQPAE